ncbi:hypothetical protein [Actinoplanes palleronii]|uniref:Lipoprotein n=1 Tax=Actinoplanes palleronii TaxID=113570 RepID=A0ABQ4BRS2_9ACTN|nr:hypothetical protein [Actinoplanes palleronii]GIE73371.1 hypothetical protein Apa02nite_094790 [Actinoplanes palleronii]
MRLRSSVLTAAVIAALTMTGCDDAAPDWPRVAGRDLNCANDTVEVVGKVVDYDIDRDGTEDHFVTMRCTTGEGAATQPGQLEVFRGGTPADNPARLAVIVRNWQNLQLSGCMTFNGEQAFTSGTDGRTTVVWAARWNPGAKPQRLEVTKWPDPGQLAGCP